MNSTGFAEDCERWRAWARSSIGGSAVEVAAAGDAVAVTSLLGGTDPGDLTAAAKTALERFSVPDESKERVRDWIAAGLPIQTPADTWRRLYDAGWFAVPLHGVRLGKGLIAENENVIATSPAEHWIWGQAPAKDDDAEKRIRHARNMLGWQGAVAQAALESLDESARSKNARPPNAWHFKDRFQYVLTDQHVLRAVDNKWEVIPFDQLAEITGERLDSGERATRLKLTNNTWAQHRLPNGELQTAVLMRTTQRHSARLAEALTDGLRSKAESTDPREAAASAYELARKLRAAGDLEAAATYYEKAAQSPVGETATNALWGLGSMWSRASQWDRSKDAFNRALAVSDAKTVPALLCELATVEREAGDYNAALATLQRAIDANDPQASIRAQFLTGALYDEQLNDIQAARRFYNEAMAAANAQWSSWAALYCGRMLVRAGETQEAVAALHMAVTRSNTCRAEAMLELGKLYVQHGRTDIGGSYLERAAASGSAQPAGEAKALLNDMAAAHPSSPQPAFSPLRMGEPVAVAGAAAADMPRPDSGAPYEKQCPAWRQWAARELAGMSTVQVAAAGDAAALTVLLGARYPNDVITAANQAASCSAAASPAAPPIQSAEATFTRLTASGWRPVPIHWGQALPQGEQIFARCSAEDWRYGSSDRKEHYATEEVGDALGEISGGFIGSIVGGVIGATVREAQKNADAKVKWRRVGTCEYLLTERHLLRLTGKESTVSPYETIRIILFHTNGGMAVCFLDGSAIMLRMPNWRLHKRVLEYAWRRYHELPGFAPSAAPVGPSEAAATPINSSAP